MPRPPRGRSRGRFTISSREVMVAGLYFTMVGTIGCFHQGTGRRSPAFRLGGDGDLLDAQSHPRSAPTLPEPNLASGMQHWLSGYANWYAKRNQRTVYWYEGR